MSVNGIDGGVYSPWAREAGGARGRDAVLEGAFDAALEAAKREDVSGNRQPAVGGSRWRNEQGRALFDGSHEVIGEKNGLPVVAPTKEEQEAAVDYLKSQAAARGQDPEAQTFIKARVPVFDGALGPKVGYYEATAMALDMSKIPLIKIDFDLASL